MTEEVVFLVEGLNEVGQLKTEISKYKNSKVFSLNYFTHKTLEKNNIKHEIGEEYLSIEDKDKINDFSINTTVEWYDHPSVKPNVVYSDINLGSLIEVEISQYLSSIFKSVVAIKKIIETEKPNIVISATYLNDLVERICTEKKINVSLLNYTTQPFLAYDKINIKYNLGSLPISFNVSRGKYLKIKKITDKITHFIYGLNPNFELQKKAILLLDFNPILYDVLLDELSSLGRNVLLLNQRRPAVWNLKSLQIVRNSKCKIINLDNFESKIRTKIIQEQEKTLSNLSTMWDLNHIFEGIFAIDSYTFWYSIKDTFTKICNERFRESIHRILLVSELLKKCDISVILEWAEIGQEEKEILNLAKKNGIKSIMLQHGMYPESKVWDRHARFLAYFSHPFMSHKQAIWGELTKEYAISHGHKDNDLVITGSPRHDKFFNLNKNTKKKGTIILATTGASGIFVEGSTTDVYLRFDNFVREVCRVVKNFPDKKLIVKPHPQSNFINNAIELINEIDPTIPIVLDTGLIELISECDLLITFNNSTIALESIILNKPTISLQIENWAEESEIVKTGAILSISEIHEIEKGIEKLLYDDEFKTTISNNASKFVELYMSNRGHASKALAKVLDDF